MTLLTCTNLSKSYSGVPALEGVSLEIRAGEVHGLVGANGAGKSTFMKILSGALPEHEGSVTFEGETLRLRNPHEALARGIAMVYQELSGIGQLSVAENIFLGRQLTGRVGFLDWKLMRRRAEDALREVGLEIDVTRRLDTFPLSVRQMIEIARCLDAGSRLFILDEPTSALSPPETRRLFELVRKLRTQGRSVIFVSHFIEDVLEICDRVSVLAGGRLKGTHDASAMTKHELIHEMLEGRDARLETAAEEAVALPPRTAASALLQTHGFTLEGAFEDIHLSLHPGEALGLYGFIGAGHQELAHALAGARRPDAGRMTWEGETIALRSPAHALRRGIAFVAADRKASLVQQAHIYKNVTLAHLRQAAGSWLTRGREVGVVRGPLDEVGCNPRNPMLTAGALSGGNQQKVVLARWLLGPVRALILEEPTRGMDVAAKADVMALVRKLKDRGAAVVIASSEPELLLGHADRIAVMRKGRIVHEFEGCSVDRAELVRRA